MTLLAFDLETHLIQPGLLAPPIVCGSFAVDDDSWLLPARDAIARCQVALMEPKQTICGANIAYDFGCVLAARPDLFPLVWKAYEEERVFDVLIAGTLDAIFDGRLREGELFAKDGTKITSGRYSLETVVRDYLGRSDAKRNDVWRKSYALLPADLSLWPEEARQYPIDDAVNTLEVARRQLKVCNNFHDLPRQAHAAFCAHMGAIWGLRVDSERAAALKIEVTTHIEEIQKFAIDNKFLKVGGTKKKPKWTKDTKYLKERVFDAYHGLPPSTPTGETSISRETLEDSGDEALVRYSEITKWEKLKVYADTLAQLGMKPLNVSCNILVSTGRASYEGLIQLMPRKGGVRECFVARPGTVWSSVDYSAIEMSTLAQVQLWALGQSTLAEALNEDLDPHSLFAAGMTGTTYDEFLKNRKRAVEAGYRQAAKAANFGFPGMMGAPKFVIDKRREKEHVCEWTFRDGKCGERKVREWKGRDLEAPLCTRCIEVAEDLRNQYLIQWPEMKAYWNWVTTEMGHEKRLEQFVSKRVRGGLSGPSGANTLFQGLAADGAKAALIAMTREMYLDPASPLYGSRLLIFAHDETIVEMPEERAHEAAHRQAEIMISEMRKYVPDVKVKAEPALMRRWYKQAEPVFANGRLAPWEPVV